MGRKEKLPLNENTLGARLRQARTEAGISLSEMAGRLGYTRSHVSGVENDVGKPSQELLAKFAELVGRSIEDLTGVPAPFTALSPGTESQPGISLLNSGNLDPKNWRTAPSFVNFYDRIDELTDLKDWVLDQGCRVVAVSGKAGMGKTALTAHLYNQIADQFAVCLWFSLASDSSPSLADVLKIAISTFSPDQQLVLAPTEDGQIAQLLACFSKRRYLLVLDGVDVVLQSGNPDGEYKKGYQGYSRLILQAGIYSHQSCLLLTSSEQLKEVLRLTGKDSPVRFKQLQGLTAQNAMPILEEQELLGSQEARKKLVAIYEGNPFVLRLVCSSIASLFSANIDLFLSEAENHSVFGDLRSFYDKQFVRLSERETEIIYWLAIEQEAILVEELHKDLMRPVLKGDLFELLAALQRRSMIIMRHDGAFTLHPGVMEYAIDTLVEHIYLEIANEEIDWLARYALLQAQARDYIREAQERLILHPLLEQLRSAFSERILEEKLKRILNSLRESYSATPGYAAGNILNILTNLRIDLKSFDFSQLVIKQAYLQQKELPGIDFRNATFDGSVFTDTFGSILSVTFSPDGSLIAAGTSHNEIRLWRTHDFMPLRAFYGHRGWVWTLAFSPDGQYLVSGSEDSTVRIWDANTGQNLETLTGYKGWIRSVTFHQEGHMLAYGGDEKIIKLWTVSTATGLHLQEYATLEGHESWIRSLAFSPDGKLLASGSEDQTIRIWDLGTRACIQTLRGHQNRVRSIAFSHDGTLLASCGEDRYACLWDMRDINNVQSTRYQPSNEKTVFISVAFNPQDKTFATGEDNGRIWYWDVNNTEQPIAILVGHINRIRPLAFSRDGTRLASGSEDQTLRLWEIKKAQCIKTFRGYSSWMWSVAFGRNANTIISGGEDNTVGLWNVNEAKCFKTMVGHKQRIWSVAFSPQMDVIASGSEDHTIRLWKASTGQYLKTLLGHTHRVRSVAFNETGRVLASGSEDQTIRLWDVNTSDSLGVLTGHERMIWGIACSRKAHLIASGSADETVRLWDAESRECIQVLEGHTGTIRAVAFNEDTSLVASGGDDRIIRLWDVKSGRLRGTLEEHNDRIYSLAFSPDGRRLASGGHDQTIKIWEVSSAICIHTLDKHTGHVWSVAFSNDGQSLVSCSEDGTIRIWNVNDGTCTQTMRSPRPYEGMQIAAIKGLTEAQINILMELGAKEGDF